MRKLLIAVSGAIAVVIAAPIALAQTTLSADIRQHPHEGVRKLVEVDVLRGTYVREGVGYLLVGSRFPEIRAGAREHLANLALRHLRTRHPTLAEVTIVDGVRGNVVGIYNPHTGLRRP